MSEAAHIVKSYVDRIEAVEDEQREAGDIKRSIYAEAKSRGYNPKALRKLIAERKRKVDEETEHDLDVYRMALEQAVNAVVSGEMGQRAAARKFGVSKSAVNRGVPREKKSDAGTPAHDEQTGEITDAGVEPPAVAEAGTSNEGQSTITLPAASATTILADPDVAAMLEAGARWNASARRERGEAA